MVMDNKRHQKARALWYCRADLTSFFLFLTFRLLKKLITSCHFKIKMLLKGSLPLNTGYSTKLHYNLLLTALNNFTTYFKSFWRGVFNLHWMIAAHGLFSSFGLLRPQLVVSSHCAYCYFLMLANWYFIKCDSSLLQCLEMWLSEVTGKVNFYQVFPFIMSYLFHMCFKGGTINFCPCFR